MSSDTSSTAESIEAGPEYDITRLLHLARLLTSNNAFLVDNGVTAETLLDLAQAPSCDADEGPFVDLLSAMSSDPPTYRGEDPIADIVMTLRQLASCQNSTERSLMTKIGDFFRHRDGGKALRGILLLSKVIIECLALWYVMLQNNLINTSDDYNQMQEFCREALTVHGISSVDASHIPTAIVKRLTLAQQWDNTMNTVVATFRVGTIYPAPVLLIFNERDLEEVIAQTEQGGLPPQQELSAGMTGDGSDTVPMTFVPRSLLRPFVENYIQSGSVKPATSS